MKTRPKLEEALKLAYDIKEAAPDQEVILTVHELKRLARNAAALMTLSNQLQKAGVQLELLTGPLTGIYDPNGMGAMFFAVLAVAAQLDRNYIREKTLEGQVAAATKGNHGGRPKVIDDDMLLFARVLKDKGVPVAAVCEPLTRAATAAAPLMRSSDPAVVTATEQLLNALSNVEDTCASRPSWRRSAGPSTPPPRRGCLGGHQRRACSASGWWRSLTMAVNGTGTRDGSLPCGLKGRVAGAAPLLMVPAGAPPGQPVGGFLGEDRLDGGDEQAEDEAGEGQGGQPPRGAGQG